MPKVRNAVTDLGQFTQWIARKCRNHNPLAELSLSDRASKPNIYSSKSKGDLYIVGETENCIVYKAKNRAFKIVVEEITDTMELDKYEESKQLVEVGY